MSVNVAVVGATGAVGDLMRKVLAERAFPIKSIKFLASPKSAGKTVEFAGKPYTVEPLRPEAFAGVQIVLSSTPGSVSKEFSPIAAKAGAIVVDNSSAWRMDPDCPLVVPEVNADELHHIKKGIVANPNCVAIPLCVALKPLHDLARVKRVVVATYQSSSGKGGKGLADFEAQLTAWAAGKPVPAPTAHRGQLAGNVITLDWTLDPNGFTEEENKVDQRDAEDPGRLDHRRLPDVRAGAGEGGPQRGDHRRVPQAAVGRRREGGAGQRPRRGAHGRDQDGQFPQPIHAEGSGPHLRRPRPPGPELPERPVPVGRRRQPPQGGRVQRRAVRGGTGSSGHCEVRRVIHRLHR